MGKIEPEVSGFKSLFLGAEVANSYKHVFGRDVAFVEIGLQKKVFKGESA